MKNRQLRTWLMTSVAAIFLLGLGISQLDSDEIYHQLQTRLATSGIQLQADDLSLSFMYTGSIRLNNVHLQSHTFEVDAERLFIDLNLAALLTGEAIPQAIYLQYADISITQEKQTDWIALLHHENLKFKRIHIVHGEIHFEQQHLTLEDVALDIRNIGENRNPRIELQAHIGSGRIDAHGYLSLKRGKVHKGFGRIKLFDIPLSNWNHGTHLETLNGSITSHLNPDTSWQAFGHLTLQQQRKNVLEVRAKVTGGTAADYLSIQNFVVNHKTIGAVQVAGGCASQAQCAFNIQSKRISLQPLLELLQTPDTANGNIEGIKITSHLNNGRWINYTQAAWQDFTYIKNHTSHAPTHIRVPEASLHISDFDWLNAQAWNIHQVSLKSSLKSEIEINKITFQKNQLSLPITFNHTNYWLPAAQWLWSNDHITGQGQINGTLNLELQHHKLTSATISLDASQAEINRLSFRKPQNVPLHIAAKLLWENEESPTFADLALTLNASTIKLRQANKYWYFTAMDIDLDQLKTEGIQLPELWRPWHGYIRGHATLHMPHENFILEEADIDLIQFGKDRHFVDGQILAKDTVWDVKNLRWTQDKNEAEFFGGKNNQFDIIAESLDARSLNLLQSLPFLPHGTLKSKALRLPFGTLRDVSASYQSLDDSLALHDFTSKFYEGTLHAKQIDVFTQGENVAMRGTIQVGGIHLNNWLWLHKQFGTHLQATVYATLNLQAEFDEKQRLSSWKGDGDVSIYNGIWLFNQKNIKADKISLKLRKRNEFNSTFNAEDGNHQGSGTLRIDEEKQVFGQLKWLDKTYIFSKTWPKFRFKEVNAESEGQATP